MAHAGLFLLVVLSLINGIVCASYDVNKEPWRTMSSEGRHLKTAVKVLGLNTTEQKKVPRGDGNGNGGSIYYVDKVLVSLNVVDCR